MSTEHCKQKMWHGGNNNTIFPLATDTLFALPHYKHAVVNPDSQPLHFLSSSVSLPPCWQFVFSLFFFPPDADCVLRGKWDERQMRHNGRGRTGDVIFRGDMRAAEASYQPTSDTLWDGELYEPGRKVLSLETTLSSLNNYQGTLKWSTQP